jgi:hypothetical protein
MVEDGYDVPNAYMTPRLFHHRKSSGVTILCNYCTILCTAPTKLWWIVNHNSDVFYSSTTYFEDELVVPLLTLLYHQVV